jgi:uncharacterized protein
MTNWTRALFLIILMPSIVSASEAERLFRHAQTAFDFTATEYGVTLLQQAASKGHADAQYMLGMLRLEGRGIEACEERAIYWFERAAFEGNQLALLQLGITSYGRGKEGREKSFRIFESLARQSLPEAQFRLGILYFTGEVSRIDFERSRQLLTQASQAGHSKAQFSLYLLEKLLLGIDSEKSDGVAWLKESAKQGYAPAQHALSHLYMNGFLKGEWHYHYWLSLAAKKGFKPAMREAASHLSPVIQFKTTETVAHR